MTKQATESAHTERSMVLSGKRQSPASYLTDLLCTPVAQASETVTNEVRQHTKLNAPYSLRQAIVIGAQDIAAGDVFVTGGERYLVHAANVWERRKGPDFTRVIMEPNE